MREMTVTEFARNMRKIFNRIEQDAKKSFWFAITIALPAFYPIFRSKPRGRL